ncbi:hypothetical protein SGLAD_v1c03940 [Spiroplasma gladiatoris]|uniref:Uncharacterized protein n=1 Tax=Spiroplasma gladiatoris TaxID=2143 RepID=A0A4P7AIP5_9MOLU|nr:hypothetical protein [Spiroplasma gladiatoris]QBQ07593.1 hypothetical protein SGLAD_v1c03940 [Spiroplasma gladiatoris]
MFLTTMFAALSISLQPVGLVISNVNDSKNIINSINRSDKVNLNDIKLDIISFNVNKLLNSDGTFDKQYLLQCLLEELYEVKATDEIKNNLTELVDDWTFEPNNWKNSTLPNKLPIKGQTMDINLAIKPANASINFKGILKLKYKLFNELELIDIGDKIKKTDLGEFVDTDNNLIKNRVIELNSKTLTNYKDSIYVENSDYEKATIKSTLLSGFVIVKFQSNLNKFGWQLQSSRLEVEAYNSTQQKTEEKSYTMDVKLGKEKFLSTFRNAYIDWSGFTYNSYDGDRWHNNDNESGNENYVIYQKKTIPLTSYSYQIEVMNRLYSNTNWTKAYGYLTLNWISDHELQIGYKINVQAYATAWNSRWARSAAQMFLGDLSF